MSPNADNSTSLRRIAKKTSDDWESDFIEYDLVDVTENDATFYFKVEPAVDKLLTVLCALNLFICCGRQVSKPGI